MTLSSKLLAIIPSSRVTAEDFITILSDGGIGFECVGRGAARVIDSHGNRNRVSGVRIIVIHRSDFNRVKVRSKLCGINIVCLEIKWFQSRANLV